jgi:hypothetical protein
MQQRCRGFTDAQLNKHVPAQRSVGRTRRAIAQDEQRRATTAPSIARPGAQNVDADGRYEPGISAFLAQRQADLSAGLEAAAPLVR